MLERLGVLDAYFCQSSWLATSTDPAPMAMGPEAATSVLATTLFVAGSIRKSP